MNWGRERTDLHGLLGAELCLDPLFRRCPFDHWVTIAQRATAAQNGSWAALGVSLSPRRTQRAVPKSAAVRRDPDVRRAWLTARQLKAFHAHGIKRHHAPGDQSGDGRPGLLLKLGVVHPRIPQIYRRSALPQLQPENQRICRQVGTRPEKNESRQDVGP